MIDKVKQQVIHKTEKHKEKERDTMKTQNKCREITISAGNRVNER